MVKNIPDGFRLNDEWYWFHETIRPWKGCGIMMISDGYCISEFRQMVKMGHEMVKIDGKEYFFQPVRDINGFI